MAKWATARLTLVPLHGRRQGGANPRFVALYRASLEPNIVLVAEPQIFLCR
jgi:hypothetical protein